MLLKVIHKKYTTWQLLATYTPPLPLEATI